MILQPEKPLLRFTVGPCNKAGIDVLRYSLHVTTATLGNDFDYVVCHNGHDEDVLKDVLGKISDSVGFYKQRQEECPIPVPMTSVKDKSGNWNVYGSECGGSLWKLAPGRMRLNAHEIIMDNDIVIFRKPKIFKKFLKQNKVMVLREHISTAKISATFNYYGNGRHATFYGKYMTCLDQSTPLNSGLIGLPPKFDFDKCLYKTWKKYGSYTDLTQWDEQGLSMLALAKQPQLRIKGRKLPLCVANEFNPIIGPKMFGIHFAQANKVHCHHAFEALKSPMYLNEY